MNTYVQRHLIDTGVITKRGLTRKTQHRHCRGCGQPVIAAQDMGHEIWCDPQPISALGELAAIVAGRATYTRVTGELSLRYPSRIAYRSADDEEVFAEHACGQPQPQPNARFVKRATRPNYDAEPPF